MDQVSCEMDSPSRQVPAVVFRDVTKSYSNRKDKFYILRHFYMTVNRGTIYGLLGPSGSGKTTILRCILGKLLVDEGCVSVFGLPHNSSGIKDPHLLKIGYMPQDIGISANLTVNETLLFFGTLYGLTAKQLWSRANFLLNLLHIQPTTKRKLISNLSGGQQRRISFAVALLNEPDLLILDEPTVGVDPVLRKKIWNYLFELASEKTTTVIITTHYIEEARMAQKVGMLYDGRLLAEAHPERIIQKYESQNLEQVFMKLCKSVAIDRKLSSTSIDDYQYLVEESIQNVETAMTKVEERKMDLPLSKGSSFYKCTRIRVEGLRWHRIKALIIKNACCRFHNTGMLFFELLLPSLLCVFFCITMGNPLVGLPVGVINHDLGNLSHMYLDLISAKTIAQVPYMNREDGIRDYLNAKLAGIITMNENFTQYTIKRLVEGGGLFMDNSSLEDSLIGLTIDMKVPQVAMDVTGELMSAYKKFSTGLLSSYGMNPMVADMPIQLVKEQIYELSGENVYNQYMLPAMVLVVGFCMPLSVATLYMIVDRNSGCFERIILTGGVMVSEFILSYFPAAILTFIIETLLMFLTIFGLFSYSCEGSYVLLFALTFVVGISANCLGFSTAAVCNDEISGFSICISLYLMFLVGQGMVWPLHGVETVLRVVLEVMPMAQPVKAMRSIMLRGWGFFYLEVFLAFLISFVWSVVFLIASCALLRWRFKS